MGTHPGTTIAHMRSRQKTDLARTTKHVGYEHADTTPVSDASPSKSNVVGGYQRLCVLSLPPVRTRVLRPHHR